MHELTGPDDARRMVNFWADEGATSFKAYMNITRDELRAAVEEAHKRGMKVTGHLCSVGYQRGRRDRHRRSRARDLSRFGICSEQTARRVPGRRSS